MELDKHVEKILWTEQQIFQRVSELASEITQDFTPQTKAPAIVGVATGAFLFLADLVRKIQLPISVDFIRADSYGSGTVSDGNPRIPFDLKVDVEGKHVILARNNFNENKIFCANFNFTLIFVFFSCLGID